MTEPGPSGGSDVVDGRGGSLYVVATPIGNLADISLRALEVLRDVPLIAAEDTRHSRVLLARHGISTRLTSYHARSPSGRRERLVAHLREGNDLALVTDAGTPGVSDPGDDLVAAWAAEGGRVVPVPGASAVLAAIAASGLAGPRWSFEGFLPRRGRDRRERLSRIADDDRGSVVFEAPDRVAGTLRELSAVCGAERPAAVCRELTKLHESIVRGTLAELAGATTAGAIPPRGEFVIVIGWRTTGTSGRHDTDPAGIEAAIGSVDRLVAAGAARGDAARQVSKETGLPRRRLYRVDPSSETPT
jgi:16S rRNA (cytidine1402-2'-O)-methyltransferase